MFRSLSVYRRFLALMLPAVVLFSWMACVAICTEITEQKDEINVISAPDDCGDIISRSSDSDNCNLTATPATFKDRQNVSSPAAIISKTAFAANYYPAFVSSFFPTDITAHSPPEISIPLFLSFRSFRI